MTRNPQTVSSTSKQRLTLSALLLMSGLQGGALSATAAEEAAWYAFQHALGEPSLIAASADHPLARTAYRPLPAFDPETIDP